MGVPVATTGATDIVTGLNVVGASVVTGFAVGEFVVAYNSNSSRQGEYTAVRKRCPS